jgi:hypothetical protein
MLVLDILQNFKQKDINIQSANQIFFDKFSLKFKVKSIKSISKVH